MYISYHIHEWIRRRRLVKFFILDKILAEWFIKSLLPKITKDVAKGGVVIEEQVIAQAQYLELVYTHSGTLYEKNLDLPHPCQIMKTPSNSHSADDVIGIVSTNKSKKKSSKSTSPIITLPNSPKGDSSLKTSAKIHVVDSSTTKAKSGNKKKVNNKNKQNTSPKEKTEKTEPIDEKRKPHYPCLICDEDHYTKECPHWS